MTFEISRSDGRSHQQALIDLVCDFSPGHLFTYRFLQERLELELERVRSVIYAAQHRLLKEHCRALVNVRARGYRMAEANDHQQLATLRKHKAQKQLQKGLYVLRYVRWEEMDEANRAAHQGQLMVFDALYQIQTSQDARIARIEEAIKKAGMI